MKRRYLKWYEAFNFYMEDTTVDWSYLIGQLVQRGAHRVTYYEGPKLIKRVTRTLYKGKLPPKGYPLEVTITHGKPNYLERAHIAKFKGKVFPYTNLHFQMPPKRRK